MNLFLRKSLLIINFLQFNTFIAMENSQFIVKSLKFQAAEIIATQTLDTCIKNFQEDVENIVLLIINDQIDKNIILKLISLLKIFQKNRLENFEDIISTVIVKRYINKKKCHTTLTGYLSNDFESNINLINSILHSLSPKFRNIIILLKDSWDVPLLINALYQNQVKFVEDLIKDLDTEFKKELLISQSIISDAIWNNYRDIALSLLEKIDEETKIKVFLSQEFHETIIGAIDNDNTETVRSLLEITGCQTKKEILLKKDQLGYSLLTYSVLTNKPQLVKILLETADTETKNKILLDKINAEDCDVSSIFLLAVLRSPESILILLDPQLIPEDTRKKLVLSSKEHEFRITKNNF